MVYYPRKAFNVFYLSMAIHTSTLQMSVILFLSALQTVPVIEFLPAVSPHLTSPLLPAMSAPVIFLSKVEGPSFGLCFSFLIVRSICHIQTSL